jgi:predicted Zn-dependent peptidase
VKQITEFPYKRHTLKNGIRLVHRSTLSEVSHCAITINVGQRDEKDDENGIAHFIEHCIFKGTKKRKFFHILNSIDGVGGELNAFTTKEETCIYATFLNRYYPKVLDLFSDIVFNSCFPQKELDKEKLVVLDEINSYEDTPSELIYDDFDNLVFDNHPLGKYILGSKKSVESFNSDKLKDFVKRNYKTSSMVISTIGSIDFSKWVLLCEKFFGDIITDNTPIRRRNFKGYSPKDKIIKRDTSQVHLILGNIAFGYKSKYRIPFSLLNNIVGGGAMNSRLNMHIREKYGFTYCLESSYTSYFDTGLFTVYAATDKEKIDKTLKLIEDELDVFCNKTISPSALKKAKEQLIGQLFIQYENNQNEVISMGKSILNYDRIDSLKTTQKVIEQISEKDIKEVAQKVFQKDMYSYLRYINN